MYRVLIVDDEDFVVSYIYELLESCSNLDICSANSAAEALGWLNRAKIDIIITDICMPEMNGIDLVEKVRLSWPQCKIIFLTAHAEFDFAYKAIKNNVVGYILKTEDDETILAEVHKAVELLDNEIKNLELQVQVEDQFRNFMSSIHKEIILSILENECENPSEYLDQLKSTGMNLTQRSFIMFIGRMNSIIGDSNIIKKFRNFSSVQKTVELYFREYFTIACVEYAPEKIVWLMQLKIGSEQETKESVAAIAGREVTFTAGILETVQRSCMDTLGLSMSFVLHGAQLEVEQLSEIFHSLNRLLSNHASENTGFIMTDTAFSFKSEENLFVELSCPEKQIMPNIKEKLKNYLENNSRETYMAEFDKITQKLCSCKSWHNMNSWDTFYSIAGAVITFINQREIVGKVAFKIELNVLFQPQLIDTWSNVVDYLRKISMILFDLQKSEQLDASVNTIHFLQEYIAEHITEDLSLIRLSELSGYNATYLSKIYKRETGETVSDYISRLKISKIKELMVDENLSIGEIATRAGFTYRPYFNRFVKKATGFAPHEFRTYLLHRQR